VFGGDFNVTFNDDGAHGSCLRYVSVCDRNRLMWGEADFACLAAFHYDNDLHY